MSEGSLIFHHASTASNYNQSQWSCTRLIPAVVSRADSDPDSRIWHAASQKKKRRSFRRQKEKHGRLNVSFPCVCALPFVLTVILSKAHSIYFNDKRLKLMLLQNKICENNPHVWFFCELRMGIPTQQNIIHLRHLCSQTFKRAHIVELAVLVSLHLPLLDHNL